MSTIVANGIRMFYELTGDAIEPLVLVHGSWTDHHSWDAVVPLLTPTFRVLRYDRRGHSQSERPPGQGSVRQDVDDLAALIEGLGLGPVHIAGNSFGASIALRLASERPELVRTLAAHEPPLFGILADDPSAGATWQMLETRTASIAEQMRRGDVTGGARRFFETLAIGPGSWDRFPPEVQQGILANASTWLDEAQDPEALTIDIAGLAGVSHPALLTHGDQSPPYFVPVIEKVAAAIPRATLRLIAGTGHVPQRTHPEAYVETITAFVRDSTPLARGASSD